MKSTHLQNARKVNREELKHLKGGIIVRDRICCFYNEDNYCCEWALNLQNCRGIKC